MFAVALGNTMFLWNAANGSITHLCELQGEDYFTSVAWVEEGEVLAVGVSEGVVQVRTAYILGLKKTQKNNILKFISFIWGTFSKFFI